MGAPLEYRPGEIRIRVRVQPNAARTAFAGLFADRVKVRLQAKPVEGAANVALVEFLAKTAGVPKSSVSILRGEKGREKDVCIALGEGVSGEAVLVGIARAAGIERESL